MTKEKAEKMLAYLVTHKMAWCFDGPGGLLWTRETLSYFILCGKRGE